MEEKPTIEEPKEEVDDGQALMEELKKLDIQTPKDVQNMAFASQEAGKAWNEVGNLRKEVDRLTGMLQQKQEPTDYDYSGESVDLGKVVEDKVQGVLNRYLQGQQQSQMMAMKMMTEVKGDPEYAIVGDVFEKYINSPEIVMQLQTGAKDYKTEYLNTKAAYYRNLAKRSASQIEKYMTTSKTAPPHMEQSSSQTTPMVDRDDVKTEQFKSVKKAQKEGNINSDQALEQIIKNVMPDLENDPSFYMP